MDHATPVRLAGRTLAGSLLLLAAAALVALLLLPSLMGQDRDGGIYATVALTVYRGQTLYRDVWESKPPVTYYLNILAFSLFGVNRWALWGFEILYYWGTVLVFGWLLRMLTGRDWLALVGAVLLLFQTHNTLLIIENAPESYALLWQVVCLLAGFYFLRKPGYRAALAIGLSAGLAFLTKQNVIGVPLTLLPAILVLHKPLRNDLHTLARYAGAMIAGGLLPLALTAAFFAAHGALDNALDNIMVASPKMHAWFGEGSVPIWESLGSTLSTPLFLLPFVPLAPLAVWGIARLRTAEQPADRVFLLWATLALGADLLLANISNRTYGHYYLPLMPTFVLLGVFALARLTAPGNSTNPRVVFLVGIYVVVAALWWVPFAALTRLEADDGDLTTTEKHVMTDYVVEHSAPDDRVLVWGLATAINFQAKRLSPSRYTYAYPVVTPDYGDVEDFVAELEAAQPVLIVDTTVPDGLRVPPLDAARRAEWEAAGGRRDTENLELLYAFVAAHCTPEHEIDEMVVYRCRY